MRLLFIYLFFVPAYVLHLCFCLLLIFFSFDFIHSGFSVSASREKCYKQIQAAIAKYREIKENINEGLKFYVTLQVRNFSSAAYRLFNFFLAILESKWLLHETIVSMVDI